MLFTVSQYYEFFAKALIFYILCNLYNYYTNAGILESPKSKNITLGEPVTLICIATGIAIEWETNPILNITQMKKNTTVLNVTNSTSTLNGTLELVGSAYTNNITVWCTAYGFSGIDNSKKAHIFIQGKSYTALIIIIMRSCFYIILLAL